MRFSIFFSTFFHSLFYSICCVFAVKSFRITSRRDSFSSNSNSRLFWCSNFFSKRITRRDVNWARNIHCHFDIELILNYFILNKIKRRNRFDFQLIIFVYVKKNLNWKKFDGINVERNIKNYWIFRGDFFIADDFNHINRRDKIFREKM